MAQNYYTNPAFCQQSEFYYNGGAPSGIRRCVSMRQAPIGAISTSPQKFERHSSLRYYHQRRQQQQQQQQQQHQSPTQSEMNEHELQLNKQIINEIRMEENRYAHCREHRYATIPSDDEDLDEIREFSSNRVLYSRSIASSPVPIPAPRTILRPNTSSAPTSPTKFNPIATQKLHQLLLTPRKATLSPTHSIYSSPPKAQQKLQYFASPNRTTAVIQPIRAQQQQQQHHQQQQSISPAKSTTESFKPKQNSNATLAVAALMMVLCGALTSAFGFYMISLVGRRYYLDFALVAGFTCFVLGLLGFRTRHCRWLPNRNYISGYIVLSMFSLLTSAGLLVLLALRPKPGTPLADVTSGAVCGLSALTLLFASLGVLSSYCCKYPPPDNRVDNCTSPGFTV